MGLTATATSTESRSRLLGAVSKSPQPRQPVALAARNVRMTGPGARSLHSDGSVTYWEPAPQSAEEVARITAENRAFTTADTARQAKGSSRGRHQQLPQHTGPPTPYRAHRPAGYTFGGSSSGGSGSGRGSSRSRSGSGIYSQAEWERWFHEQGGKR